MILRAARRPARAGQAYSESEAWSKLDLLETKKREDESSLIATIILQQKLYSQLSLVCLRVSRSSHQSPHERLLGIQRVANQSTENQRISTPAYSNGWK